MNIQLSNWLQESILDYILHTREYHDGPGGMFYSENWPKDRFESLSEVDMKPVGLRFNRDDVIKWVVVKVKIKGKAQFLSADWVKNNGYISIRYSGGSMRWSSFSNVHMRNMFTGRIIYALDSLIGSKFPTYPEYAGNKWFNQR